MQQHVSQFAPGEGRAVHMSGDTDTFKVVGATSDGMLTIELHRFKNVGAEPAKMLLLFTPGGIEEMFFGIGTPVTPGSSPSPPDAAEVAKVLAIGPEYGMEVPPLPLQRWRDDIEHAT